jgi:hypothetical protein
MKILPPSSFSRGDNDLLPLEKGGWEGFREVFSQAMLHDGVSTSNRERFVVYGHATRTRTRYFQNYDKELS